MTIPEPNEFAKKAGYRPFPPRWEKWLSAIRASLLASQPTAGRNVTTDEHIGKGTVINVLDRRVGSPSVGGLTGACCVGNVCSIKTAAECDAAGGIYQGNDTECNPSPCGTAIGCCPANEGIPEVPGLALGILVSPGTGIPFQMSGNTTTSPDFWWTSFPDSGSFSFQLVYLSAVDLTVIPAPFDVAIMGGHSESTGSTYDFTFHAGESYSPVFSLGVGEGGDRIVGFRCQSPLLSYTLSYEVTGFNPTCAAGPSIVSANPNDVCEDPLNVFHYINDTGGIDTGTAFFSMFLTKNNGDGPTGHFMLQIIIACTGMGSWQPNSCGATFIDLGTDPRGTFSWSADGDDATCGVTGVHYSATLVIS